MAQFLEHKYSRLAVFLSSVVVPGSGFVLLGRPARGLMYVVWILFFGILTYKATTPHISMIGRLSGGIAIWALSLVELHRLLKARGKA
jgi:hypothetical protein